MEALSITQEPVAEDGKSKYMITLAASLGYMFDAYVINIYGVTLPGIIAEFHTSMTTMALLGCVLVAGYTIGSFLFGMLGDRYGRRITLGASIFAYGVVSAATGFAQNTFQFGVGRFFTGVGGGGELTVGVPYIIETWKAGKRAIGTALMFGGYSVGVLLTFFCAKIMMEYLGFGWRSLYLFSIIPAILILVVRLKLEESPRYVATIEALKLRGREKVTFGSALKIAKVRKLFLWGILIYASITTIYYVQAFYQIAVMKESFHTPTSSALYIVGGFAFAMFLGTAFGGVMGDRMPRKIFGGSSLIVCGAAIWLMYSTTSLWMYLTFGAISWFSIGISWTLGMAHVGELFPTEIRGSGFGWAVAIGRIPSIIAPFIGVMLADELHVSLASLMKWSFTLLLFGLVTYVFGPETHKTDVHDLVEHI